MYDSNAVFERCCKDKRLTKSSKFIIQNLEFFMKVGLTLADIRLYISKLDSLWWSPHFQLSRWNVNNFINYLRSISSFHLHKSHGTKYVNVGSFRKNYHSFNSLLGKYYPLPLVTSIIFMIGWCRVKRESKKVISYTWNYLDFYIRLLLGILSNSKFLEYRKIPNISPAPE